MLPLVKVGVRVHELLHALAAEALQQQLVVGGAVLGDGVLALQQLGGHTHLTSANILGFLDPPYTGLHCWSRTWVGLT